MEVVARCEVDGVLPSKDPKQPQLISIKALNEFDFKAQVGPSLQRVSSLINLHQIVIIKKLLWAKIVPGHGVLFAKANGQDGQGFVPQGGGL